MQKLLVIFDYLKRYHSDILDAICILLNIMSLRIHNPKAIHTLLEKARKRKPIAQDFENIMIELLGDLYTEPNSKINLIKILRTINEVKITNTQTEILINIITQKKTINKLYSYSTPMEVNKLIIDILDIQDNDEIYNPCYGMGSLFLALSQTNKKFTIYGEELDPSLDKIARLVLKTLNISSDNLYVNNILKKQIFPPERKFNKIICNPPINTYIGILDLKKNERFATYGLIAKSAPELSFIINGISYLKDKGVFVIRNKLLKKTSLQEKFKEKLCKERLLEAVIELPKNIFPHMMVDFSIMIISRNNEYVMHVDASRLYEKDGKYNKLIKTDIILNALQHKKTTPYSKLTHIKDIDVDDLRVQHYFKEKHNVDSTHTLKSMGVQIIRGQRIYNTKISTSQKYLNIGIAHFNEYGFIDESDIEEHIGDKEKIQKCRLQPYDILLSLRGTTPKITIINASKKAMIANTGILILRAKNKNDAIKLYCFLFSNAAHKILSELYEQTDKKTIDIRDLYDVEVPQSFGENAEEKFNRINSIGKKLNSLQKELESLR